jgi:hypothetical protein
MPPKRLILKAGLVRRRLHLAVRYLGRELDTQCQFVLEVRDHSERIVSCIR